MIIQFLCPNGHKIHCDSKRAGLAAKCPKCGEKFRVPTLEELESAGATLGETAPPQAAGSSVQAAATVSAVGRGPATAADQIEFLCPNNHLVHASATLQGKPGECPECGSKFRVPSYDEVPPEGEPLEPEAAGAVARGSIEALEDVSQLEEHGAARAPARPGESATPQTGDLVAPSAPGVGTHPFFSLFCRLWAFKPEEATLEIRYGEGQRITPDRFGEALSRGSHAVFSVDEPNGTHTLTIVPWDSIGAVVIRGAKSLPGEMKQ
jgi:hypothetical protein